MSSIYCTCLILILTTLYEGAVFGQDRDLYAANLKNNYVYLGVSNPIKIGVTGIPKKSLRVRALVGELKKLNDDYSWEICDHSLETAYIYVDGIGEFSEFRDSTLFRIKKLPNPGAKLVAKEHVPSRGIENYFAIVTWFEDFEYDVRCEITSYKLRILRKDQVIGRSLNIGEAFTAPIKQILKMAGQGDILEFYQIECRCPCDRGRGAVAPCLSN